MTLNVWVAQNTGGVHPLHYASEVAPAAEKDEEDVPWPSEDDRHAEEAPARSGRTSDDMAQRTHMG
jgi:hypothetical protein